MVKKIKTSDFEAEVLKSDIPVLIDFYADWCGPCRSLAPIVEEISNEIDNVLFVKVNVDDEPELSEKYKITTIPMLALIVDGELKTQLIGLRSKDEILKLIG